MKILEGYIGRTLIGHSLMVLVVMLALYFFSAFIDEMSEVGKGTYGMVDAVVYTGMLIPRQIYEIFPMVALLGTMLGLGALANSSELTVMRAAGISVRQVVVAVFKAGMLMVVVVSLLGEVLAPQLEKAARIERAKALAKNLSFNTGAGLWARDEDTFIHIDRLLADGQAYNVELFSFREGSQLRQMITARRAVHDGNGWRLINVTVRDLDGSTVHTRQVEEMPWRSHLSPEVAELVAVPPQNLSIVDLYSYYTYLRDNGLDSKQYESAIWSRLAAPFAAAGMVLLAIPFVFGSLRSVGVGQRVMIGALIGIGFFLFNNIFARLGVLYDIPPVVSATLPTLLVFTGWWLLMRRIA